MSKPEQLIFNALAADAPASLRAEPFWRMGDEGLLPVVLYGHKAHSIFDWHSYTAPGTSWLVRVEQGAQLAGVVWLNSFSGRSALAHFCVFRAYQPQAVAMGRAFMRWAFASGCFDSLSGVTPSTYRHALALSRAIGFVPMGRVPGACLLARTGRCVDAVVSVATVQSIPEEED